MDLLRRENGIKMKLLNLKDKIYILINKQDSVDFITESCCFLYTYKNKGIKPTWQNF